MSKGKTETDEWDGFRNTDEKGFDIDKDEPIAPMNEEYVYDLINLNNKGSKLVADMIAQFIHRNYYQE